MAPSRKRPPARSAPKPSARGRRVDAFLKDFDREVRARLEQVRATRESLQKEVGNLYNLEVLRLPVALREMNWIGFLALGSSDKALEKVASAELDIAEITQLASKAIQTPLRTARKAKKVKQAIETIEEETGTPLLPAGKRSRQEKEPAGAREDPETQCQRLGKAQASTKRAPISKRSCPPSSRSTHFHKRSSKVNLITPVSCGAPAKAASPAPTPTAKFDSSVFKTPGLRAPATHERVFSVSVNGSPLADSSEVFLTLPVGGGESIRVRASELSKKDLMGLNAQTLGSVKKLSSQLAYLCSSVRSHK
ncbi:borealin isoform X2 [Candoia aspera]|uniref:borealin isoform X2 n=1 Tax=Candoia aspera TaxID=51853 RepID=UPI002FD8195C